MPNAEKKFDVIAESLAGQPDTTRGQMFGKPCVKVNDKAFIAFHKNEMVFKLPGDAHKKALAIKGAHLWDPSGKGRPMKEWVCIPESNSSAWKKLAASAQAYVAKLASK